MGSVTFRENAMTTVEDSKAGSALSGSNDVNDLEATTDAELTIEQVVMENQERAKELTERAAAVTDPSEREMLLRLALDHEVHARVQNDVAQGILPESALEQLDEEAPELASEIGQDALSGPLLDVTSTIMLQEALTELEGGLNADAVGGFFFDQEGSKAASPVDPSTPMAVGVEPALPAIEEVLKSRDFAQAATATEIGQAEAPLQKAEELSAPLSDQNNGSDDDVSVDEEDTHALRSDEKMEIQETTEVTVTKTEVIDNDSPTRKPKKLEIKTRKKPRKLEIRSGQQSP